jgi:hypothetical protein
METPQNYKLIDGTFTAEEAEKVLIALFNYKIDYHNREDFSNHIRFNKDIEHSRKRIAELTTTKEKIKQLIANSKSDNFNLVINSTITICLEKQNV